MSRTVTEREVESILTEVFGVEAEDLFMHTPPATSYAIDFAFISELVGIVLFNPQLCDSSTHQRKVRELQRLGWKILTIDTSHATHLSRKLDEIGHE